MAYFRRLPNVIYPVQQGEKNFSHDYSTIKNFFRRPFIPADLLKIYGAFEDYQIQGDERPDNVSQNFYGSPEYDWVIFLANNIQNVRTDWPMTQSDLNKFLFTKYTEAQLSEIHHYETTEVKNSLGHVILKAGIRVKSDFTFQYTEFVAGNTVIKNHVPVRDVTNYEYELLLNDQKRSIVLIRQEFIRTIEVDANTILRYKPSSSYIDPTTIKVADQCIPPM